jgi:hypothetical protein
MRLLLLFAALSFPAWGTNVIINCGNTTLTTTYSTSSPSLAINQAQYKPNLAIFNDSTGRVCINTVTASTSVAPTAGDGNEHCIPATTFAIFDKINVNTNLVNVYVRGDGGNCTSGIVDIDLW